MGRTITATKGSSALGVTVFANQANVFSSIFRLRTPKSRFYTVLGNQPLILKLAKADGTEIDPTSNLLPAYLEPTMRLPVEHGAITAYAAWRYTPLASTNGEPTQYNVETSARRVIQFKTGKSLTLPQEWEFHLMLESPDVVDWTHANTFIELKVDESSIATQVAG